MLEPFREVGEEKRAAMAVADAVVGSDGERRNRADSDRVVFDPRRARRRADADDRHLRRIDHAVHALDAAISQARQRDGRVGDF